MPLPNVEIPLLDNQLGRVESSPDRVPGLILSGIATDYLELDTPTQIFTLQAAIDLGIDSAYDEDNSLDAYRQIKEFYDQAGNGQELWFMIIDQAVTMEDACDKANDYAKLLLDAAQGAITVWGITRVPDEGYTAALTKGFDDDAYAAILKADALCKEYTAAFKPCRAIIGARDFQGVPADLVNLRANTNNNVAVLLGNSKASDTGTCMGHLLGRIASIPVQRNIGRVKDGDMGLVDAYFSNGASVMTLESAWDTIHDKGYIFFRKFAGINGFFYNDDPTCSPKSGDYSSLARGFVIDKAVRITYGIYVTELQDDLDTDDDGFLDPSVVKAFQQKIINAINANMRGAQVNNNNISGVECEIDPKQNLLQNDTVTIKKLGVRPKGYSKYIYVPLGFTNPLNNA